MSEYGIKIRKLPDEYALNKILDSKIKNRYRECPFCHTISYEHRSTYWYGKNKTLPFWKRWFSKKGYWRIDHFSCQICGAKWDTPAYPTDVPYIGSGIVKYGELK